MKAIRWILIIVALLLAAFSVVLYQAHARFQPFTESYHLAGGESASLSAGRLSYQWHGPTDGDIVVLVHGFSTPKFVWQNTIPALVDAGFRVLSFDHFGRGHSERPRVNYNRTHYVQELQELLDYLDIQAPVAMVGYSMGGANITSFAAQYPERVKQLILLAPAGFLPPYTGTFKQLSMPVIGEQMLILAGADRMTTKLHQAVEKDQISPETVQQFKTQFYIEGSAHALTSTLRHYPMYDLSEDYRLAGKTGISVTAIWGDADRVVPHAGAAEMKKRVPQLKLHTVTGAYHDFTFTQASEVNPLILQALRTP